MVKKLISLVKPGLGDTRASARCPANMFSRDDLPTLDRPMKANSGNDSSGHESRSGALRSKMADEMFIIKSRGLSQLNAVTDRTISESETIVIRFSFCRMTEKAVFASREANRPHPPFDCAFNADRSQFHCL